MLRCLVAEPDGVGEGLRLVEAALGAGQSGGALATRLASGQTSRKAIGGRRRGGESIRFRVGFGQGVRDTLGRSHGVGLFQRRVRRIQLPQRIRQPALGLGGLRPRGGNVFAAGAGQLGERGMLILGQLGGEVIGGHPAVELVFEAVHGGVRLDLRGG